MTRVDVLDLPYEKLTCIKSVVFYSALIKQGSVEGFSSQTRGTRFYTNNVVNNVIVESYTNASGIMPLH